IIGSYLLFMDLFRFYFLLFFFFFSSRRRHTRWPRDWSSDVCSSDLIGAWLPAEIAPRGFDVGYAHLDVLVVLAVVLAGGDIDDRSEERRVGKECRSRWAAYH